MPWRACKTILNERSRSGELAFTYTLPDFFLYVLQLIHGLSATAGHREDKKPCLCQYE